MSKKVKGVEQIKTTFDKVKSIKVGMEKPGSTLKAMKVFDIMPNFQALPQQILHVLNEDIGAIEENLDADADKKQFYQNNGQLMMHYQDRNDKKFALYRKDHETELSDELAKITLGKRVAPNRPYDLNQAL